MRAPAPDIWMQSLLGRDIAMVEPRVDQVDFEEIAWTLAGLNRYAGAALKAVSVANHTLIADRCAVHLSATPRLRALVALHDNHEAVIGEITTPAAHALAAVARQVFGGEAGRHVSEAIRLLKARHDEAIHVAAGIARPDADETLFVRRCDLMALNTERRDFLAAAPRPWAIEVETAPRLPSRQRLLAPGDAALALHRLFLELLPGARAQSRREAGIGVGA